MARGKPAREIGGAPVASDADGEDGAVSIERSPNVVGPDGPALTWAEIEGLVVAAQALDQGLRIVSIHTTATDAPGELRLPFSCAVVTRGDTNLYQTADGRDHII